MRRSICQLPQRRRSGLFLFVASSIGLVGQLQWEIIVLLQPVGRSLVGWSDGGRIVRLPAFRFGWLGIGGEQADTCLRDEGQCP